MLRKLKQLLCRHEWKRNRFLMLTDDGSKEITFTCTKCGKQKSGGYL